MFKSFLISAIRNVLRNKVFSVINILGFAFSIACALLILLWVQDELSYDKFLKNGDQIYRVNTIDTLHPGEVIVTSPFPLAPGLADYFPEIINYSRYFTMNALVEYEDISIFEPNGIMADTGFFRMFDLEFVQGNPRNAMIEKATVVISETLAKKYFKEENVVGKILTMRDTTSVRIDGVFKDYPLNSHMRFDYIVNINNMNPMRLQSWYFAGFSYILLADNVSKNDFNDKIKDVYQTADPQTTLVPFLQNVKNIRLYEYGTAGRVSYIVVFTTVAVLLLIVAGINFVNLSTARSSARAKEIGIRKVIGSTRRQVATQFFGESIMYTLIAGIIAFMLVELVRPWFNTLTGKSIDIHYDPKIIGGLFLIIILTGLISGIYPAMVLSSFKPVNIFRGNFPLRLKRNGYRKILVVVQFAITVVLITVTIIIYNQLNYINTKDVGYSRENIVVVPYNNFLETKFDVFKSELLQYPDIENVTATTLLPISVDWSVSLDWDGNKDDEMAVFYIMADYDYIETLEMEMLYGRSFSKDFANDDSISYIINETALKQMGVDNPIGLDVSFIHNEFPEQFRKGKIVGVVKDFHYRCFVDEIVPFVMRMYRPWYNHVLIKIDPEDFDSTIDAIESTFNKFSPQFPFEYSFLEQEYKNLYRSEAIMGTIMKYFTYITIIISCLGLFGMATFMAEKRTKEIGIRKVNGASVEGLVFMLTKDFTKWVVMAIVIACPIAWYISRSWLNNYTYRVDNNWWVFILAGGLVIFTAIVTVSYQAFRAASCDPVEAIRYE